MVDSTNNPPQRRRKPLPEMTDESAKAYRDSLVAAGHLTPSDRAYGPYERPTMLPEAVKKLRARLILANVIKPAGSLVPTPSKEIQ